MENAKAQGNVEEFRLPEWETTARRRGEKEAHTGQKPSVKKRAFILFDHVMPGYKKYLGFSRKGACIAISVIFLALLALIPGLAIGRVVVLLQLRHAARRVISSYSSICDRRHGGHSSSTQACGQEVTL